MHIISKPKLRAFWTKHADAKDPLSEWYWVVERVEWSGPNEVRNTYRTADTIGDEFVVFNICNNKYRLVVRVHWESSTVYVWDVYTHSEYNQLDLKQKDKEIQRELKRKREAKRKKGKK